MKRCNSDKVSSFPSLIESNIKIKETIVEETKPIIHIEKEVEHPIISQSNDRNFQGINNSKPTTSLHLTTKSKKNKSKIEKNNSISLIPSNQTENSIKIHNVHLEENLEDPELIYFEMIRDFIQNNSSKNNSKLNYEIIIDSEILKYLLDTIAIYENDGSDLSSFIDEALCELIESYFPSLTNNLIVLKEFITLLQNIGIEKNKLEDKIRSYQNISSKNEINNEVLNEEIKTNVQIVVKEKYISERDILDKEEINNLHSMMPNIELDLIRHVYINIGNRSSVEAGTVLAACLDDEKAIKKLQESKISFDAKQIEIAKQNDLDTKQIQSTIWNKFGDTEIKPKFNKNGIYV